MGQHGPYGARPWPERPVSAANKSGKDHAAPRQAADQSALALDGVASGGSRAALMAPARPMRVLGSAPGRYALLGPELDGHGALVCLEAPGGIELPVSVVVDPRVLDDAIDPASEVVVGDGGVRVGNRQVVVRRWISDRVVWDRRFDAATLGRLRADLAQAPAPLEPAVVFERTEEFTAALIEGTATELRHRAEALIGLGLGATPAGDDVVAAATATLQARHGSHLQPRGAAVQAPVPESNVPHDDVALRKHRQEPALRDKASGDPTGDGTPRLDDRRGAVPMTRPRTLDVLQSVIDDRAAHTAPLSAALLQAAAQGRAIRALRDFIAAGTGSHNPDSALKRLLAVGHSSGYFLAAGALAAARAVADQPCSERASQRR